MKRTGWIVLGVLVLLVVGGAYAASPFLAAQDLGQAFKNGDRDRLAADIDFPAVRENLKADVRAKLMANMANDASMKNNPFAALGAMMVPTIVNNLVDGYVTPEGISTFIKNQTNTSPNGRPKFNASYAGLNRFIIASEKGEGSDQVRLIMERHGLFSWKVERIELPTGALSPTASQAATAETPPTEASPPTIEPPATIADPATAQPDNAEASNQEDSNTETSSSTDSPPQ